MHGDSGKGGYWRVDEEIAKQEIAFEPKPVAQEGSKKKKKKKKSKSKAEMAGDSTSIPSVAVTDTAYAPAGSSTIGMSQAMPTTLINFSESQSQSPSPLSPSADPVSPTFQFMPGSSLNSNPGAYGGTNLDGVSLVDYNSDGGSSPVWNQADGPCPFRTIVSRACCPFIFDVTNLPMYRPKSRTSVVILLSRSFRMRSDEMMLNRLVFTGHDVGLDEPALLKTLAAELGNDQPQNKLGGHKDIPGDLLGISSAFQASVNGLSGVFGGLAASFNGLKDNLGHSFSGSIGAGLGVSGNFNSMFSWGDSQVGNAFS